MGITLSPTETAAAEVRNTLTPAAFAQHASRGRWQLRPHLKLLNDAVARAAVRGGGRILVSMPPRHGKSEFLSKYVPAWHIGTFPDRRVILGSYGAALAEDFGGNARDLLIEHGDLFGVKVADSTSAKGKWGVKGRLGGLVAVGVGGAIVGKGGDLIIVDDPHKDAKEAASKTFRDAVWRWYQGTLYNRQEPGATIIVIQTRWHQDDLTGRLLEHQASGEGDRWDYIRIPAVAEEDDLLGREVGEALWPERYPLETTIVNGKKLLGLNQLKAVSGSYYWSALYQQSPIPDGGEIFNPANFRYQDACPTRDVIAIRYWDKAGTRDAGDYTAGVLMVYSRVTQEFFVADVQRGRWSDGVRERVITRTLERDHQQFGYVMTWIEQEPGSGGKDSATNTIRNNPGWPMRSQTATGDKVTRARSFAAQVEIENVVLINGDWNLPYVEELQYFPNGQFDDQVDASSGAFNKLFPMRGGGEGGDIHMETSQPKKGVNSPEGQRRLGQAIQFSGSRYNEER